MTGPRARVRANGGLLLCCGLLALLSGVARAQPSDHVEGDADDGQGAAQAVPTPLERLRPRYEVTLAVSARAATRDDFSRQIFLLQQPLRRLQVRELRYTLGLHVDVTPALYLRAELPITQRHLQATIAELVVSADEVVPPLERELSGFGLADPTLAIGYRPLAGELSFDVELAAVVAIQDNPASNTFPRQLPLSTGQSEYFGALGPRLQLDGLTAAITYRLGLFPGSPATYLVRRIGNQSYASGALAHFFEHTLRGELAVELFEPVWLELAGDYRQTDQPQIVVDGKGFGFLPETHRWTVGGELGLRFGVARAHDIELRYRHLFREDWYEDPFFPIAIPDRGLTLTWIARAQ